MNLTNDIILENGFKQVNNSVFRLKNITLQNSWFTYGSDIMERLLNSVKGYRCCVDGKYINHISTKRELDTIMLLNLIYNNY